MLCAHCSKPFGVNAVTNQRGKGFNAQVQCPHCTAWLGNNPILTRLKVIGFYLAVAAVIYGYFEADMRNVTTPLAIVSVIVLLVTHLMDQLKVTEAPEIEEIDDSEHRQKYR